MVYFITYGQVDASKMLDDVNVIRQRDPSGALAAVKALPEQARFEPVIEGDVERREVTNIVLAGMGGSALAADMVKALLKDTIGVPIEVVKGYDLPAYVGWSTLVVTLSHSGNTEETLECYRQARHKGSLLAVMATGGSLFEWAENDGIVRSRVPAGAQPRMSTVYHLRVLLKLLQEFGLTNAVVYDEVAGASDWLAHWLQEWAVERPLEHNYAKQLAERTVGKTPLFYGGDLTAPIAYKWKISWNETAKNVSFYNQYPEFSHNEFMGWTSHPVEKPFAVFDIQSSFERPRIAERMSLTDSMLSGKRPKASVITLECESLVRQFLWGLALADMTSIYGAILNGVDPTPVGLIEKFKASLS